MHLNFKQVYYLRVFVKNIFPLSLSIFIIGVLEELKELGSGGVGHCLE